MSKNHANLIATEKTKLSANFVNGIALATVGLASIGPAFKIFYSNDDLSELQIIRLSISSFVFLAVAVFAHWRGRELLNDIPKPDEP